MDVLEYIEQPDGKRLLNMQDIFDNYDLFDEYIPFNGNATILIRGVEIHVDDSTDISGD
jgi:hypothetical protein